MVLPEILSLSSPKLYALSEALSRVPLFSCELSHRNQSIFELYWVVQEDHNPQAAVSMPRLFARFVLLCIKRFYWIYTCIYFFSLVLCLDMIVRGCSSQLLHLWQDHGSVII